MHRSTSRLRLFYVFTVIGLLLIAGCRSPESEGPSFTEAVESASVVATEARPAHNSEITPSIDSEMSDSGSVLHVRETLPSGLQTDTNDGRCPFGLENTIRIVSDSSGYRANRDIFTSGNWLNSDINNDGRIDIGLMSQPSNYGVSRYALYVSCGGNQYVSVLNGISAYNVTKVSPNSTVSPDSPSSVPTAYAKTKSGQKWRQLRHITRGHIKRTDGSGSPSVSRIYRLYEELERYALVPGSAWFSGGNPYTKAEMRQAGGYPPDCPAGRDTPTIIDSTMQARTVWRGDLNKDEKEDRIVRGTPIGQVKPTQYTFEVYAKCEGRWYTQVHRQRYAISLTETGTYTVAPNGSQWQNLHVRFHEPGDTEVQSHTIRFSHAVYGGGLP